MSPSDRDPAMSPLETPSSLRRVLEDWAGGLADVLESMTEHRPKVDWRPGTASDVASGAGDPDVIWWEQSMRPSPEQALWVATPRATWEYAGTLTLKAAGLDTVGSTEARNTWMEILGQSISVLARSVGAILGREVTAGAGSERQPGPEVREWALVTLLFEQFTAEPVCIGFSPQLVSLLANPEAATAQAVETPPSSSAPRPGGAMVPARSRTMDLLLEVELPVTISFGRAQLPLKDVLKLTTGSIVELNRNVGDQVEVLVNQQLIARGEVVVVDGNYGVRLQEIVSRQDRLRSIQ